MNPLELHLEPLKAQPLSMPLLEKEIRKLERITSHLSKVGSLDTPDQIAELRNKVRTGFNSGESLYACTLVPRRDSRLLTLYLLDLGADDDRKALPPFDKDLFNLILGDWDRDLKNNIRRQATLLYFTHFGIEKIPALNLLAGRLQNSWGMEFEDRLFDSASRAYRTHADILFDADAPSKVAGEWLPGESIDQLSERFGIPTDGEFRERLFEEVILERVRGASEDETGTELDSLVASSKERRFKSGYPLGAEAVRILIDRSVDEFQGIVPAGWREQIVTYSCDPRIPNASEQIKWWGWASSGEKDVAIRALSELTLEEFIKLLERSLIGTEKAHQFPERKRVLLMLFELGKVIEARLVVHQELYQAMGPRIRDVLRPSRTRGGRRQTSFICLRCTDDVFLIEGTHDFALRGFVGPNSFPITAFWSTAPKLYDDNQLRTKRDICDIYQIHHQGDWAWDLNQQLRPYQGDLNGL